MIGYNSDINSQIEHFEEIIMSNGVLCSLLTDAENLGLDYYIGAGCIAQTIWNYQMNQDLNYGISDIDFVYYDSSDLSFEAERRIIKRVKNELDNCPINLDIKNQARVHIWYKEHFGYDIEPYHSLEEAINTWPTTATSIGVRLERNKLIIYAPFGLNDVFGLIVKANKAQITEKIYLEKVNKWKAKWSSLRIVPW